VRVTRDLGLFDVTMAAVGAMVGAAIFLLVGATYTVAGPFLLVSLAIAALVAMLAGMSYAELASGRPDASGGAYVWVRSALPSPAGFLSGWLSWGAHMAATSLGALGLGVFLLELISPFGVESFFGPNPIQVGFAALAVLGLSAILHFARIHLPVRALGRLTLAKVLLIVVLAAIGLTSVLPANPLPPAAAPATSLDLVLGAGVLFIAFQGFEVVAQLGDQAKRPELTVPRAMFVALLLSSLVYAAFLVAILGNAPSSAVAGWPICTACRGGSEDIFLVSIRNASLLGQPYIRVAFLVVGVLSMYGALNAHLSSAIKTSFSLARDRLLPAVFARIGGREVPPAAVAFTVLGAGVLVFLTVETIAVLASLAFLGLFAFVHASVIALRRRERRSGPGFRVPFVPVVPMLAVALNLALGATLWNFPAMADSPIPPGEMAVSLGGLWLGIGLAYHWFVGRRRPHPSPAPTVTEVHDILTMGEERVELERYRVFLPLREFEDRTLVDLGARVARARNGELSLLHVVEIPRNLPPKAIRFGFVDERIRGLQALARIGEGLGVDTRPVVKIGHKVYEIILDTIREEAVNLLIMGWRGARIEGDRRVLGSNIDYLIENAPCDVIVFKTQGWRRPLRRIVILTSAIWSLEGIDDLALLLGEDDSPVIEVVCLASDPAEAERLKLDSARFEGRARERGLSVEPKVVYSTHWETEALRESGEASLLMIRATSPGGLRKFALGPVEDRIVKLAKCPVLILRKGA